MIGLLVAAAFGAPHLDRVDVLSDDPGWFLTEDLRQTSLAPDVTAVRFLGQITPVVALGKGWQVGASLSSQAIRREWWLEGTWSANVALSTHYGLPRGALFGLSVRPGPLRVALSAAAMSEATWENLAWRQWTVGPVIAVGVVRRPRAPWM